MNADKNSTARVQNDMFDDQTRVIEARQWAPVHPDGAQPRDSLRTVNVIPNLDGLQFHDHQFFDRQARLVFTSNDPIVDRNNTKPPLDRKTSRTEVVREPIFINLSNESDSKHNKDHHHASDNSLRGFMHTRFIGVHLRTSAAKSSLLPSHAASTQPHR